MYQVLIIDDREVFRRKLKRIPYWEQCPLKFQIIHEASNGLEALDYLRIQKVDLVLTDIRMPLVDGITLLKTIKKENLCDCVILLSEYAEFTYAKEGILNGAFDYIVKPIDNLKIKNTFERAYAFLSTLHESTSLIPHCVEALSEHLISGNQENTQLYSQHIHTQLKNTFEDPKEIAIQMNVLLKDLERTLFKQKPYLQKYLFTSELFYIDVKQALSRQDDSFLSEWINRILKQLDPFLFQTNNQMIREMCEQALEQPEKKYSLTAIANRYFVNPKYLGSLFKQELHVSFSKYLTILKTHRAKRLLTDNTLKIYEIAEILGYEDVDYFSRLFKDMVGTPPSVYRETYLKKRIEILY